MFVCLRCVLKGEGGGGTRLVLCPSWEERKRDGRNERGTGGYLNFGC